MTNRPRVQAPPKCKPPTRKAPHVAGAAGFEPPDAGIKTPCLTAWLRPIFYGKIAPESLKGALSHNKTVPGNIKNIDDLKYLKLDQGGVKETLYRKFRPHLLSSRSSDRHSPRPLG